MIPSNHKETQLIQTNQTGTENETHTTDTVTASNNLTLLDDWQIRLVNRENPLPDDFTVELENLDASRKFDKKGNRSH